VRDEVVPRAVGDELRMLQLDLRAANDQFAATNEVLNALVHNAADPELVFDTIVGSARRLCRADVAQIYRVDGDSISLSQAVGLAPEAAAYLREHPLRLDRSALVGRVGLERRTDQIVDVLADPDYGRLDLQRIAGFRTTVGSPLLLDDEVVGVLVLWRNTVDAFDEREVAVLETFSAQAAIAVRTLELVEALDSRGLELARKVDQLEALAQVGEALNSSLDLDEVLHTIVVSAVRMAGADGGSIMQYVADEGLFSVRTTHGTSPELVASLKLARIHLDETLVGRSAREGRPLQVADLALVERDPHLELMFAHGWRSVLAAPMIRQGQIVGALVIRRRSVGRFSATTVDLLATFASQSALAIYNAGLFRELQVRTRELQVVSQHKSDFLASMSHELRTPLNAVIGFSEVLLERMFGDINERQEEYLRDIWSSGRHLLELLNEILDLSKVEAGRMELTPCTFSVLEALDYAATLVRDRALAHGITVTVDAAHAVGYICADELRFKQVVVNLVTNAVKFAPDSGHVSVRAYVRADDVCVEVTDDGPGVRPEDQERIFESFQ
jgi:signal transduction histidine kinase